MTTPRPVGWPRRDVRVEQHDKACWVGCGINSAKPCTAADLCFGYGWLL
jgi:hypothetical protein